jgi:hypothetical protein
MHGSDNDTQCQYDVYLDGRDYSYFVLSAGLTGNSTFHNPQGIIFAEAGLDYNVHLLSLKFPNGPCIGLGLLELSITTGDGNPL